MPAICVAISSVAFAVCDGELLHLGSDHREAAPGFAGARRLDRGVERQQVGLLGDRRDQLDHVADAAGRLRQRRDARVGLLRLRHRFRRSCSNSYLPAISPTDEVISSVADATDCTLDDASSEAAATMPDSCCADSAVLAQRAGRGFELRCRRRHRADDAADALLEIGGQLAELLAALRALLALLLLLAPEHLQLDVALTEGVQRACHVADFVAARLVRHRNVLLGLGQVADHGGELADRFRDRAVRERDGAGRDRRCRARAARSRGRA